MKKINVLLALFVLMSLVGCGVQRSQAYYDYKSKIIGTELDGSYTIRAFGRARNAVDAYQQARKQAVYDVVFNGVQSDNSMISPLKPLLLEPNAKEQYADYFNKFFADNGTFEKYCSMKERRWFSSNYSRTDAQSMAQVTVCVDVAKLRERLKSDGIIDNKSLNFVK